MIGILRNISPLPPPTPASSIDIDKDTVLPLLLPVISSISLSEASKSVQDLLARQASEPVVEKPSLKNTPKSDHKSPIETELEKLEGKLRTVQLSLEILTGVCATLPDPDPDVPAGKDNEDDEDEADVENGTADIEMSIDNPPSADTVSTTSSFLSSLIPPLLALVHPTTLSFPPLAAPSPHPPTTSVLSAIHISALECLNNIFLSLATSPNSAVTSDPDNGRKLWDDIWSAISVVGTETGLGQERRMDMWEIGVGVLWGIGTVWKRFLVPKDDQVQILIHLCDAASDPRIRVKCIGTLECLAQHPDSVEGNRMISNYLLSLLPTVTAPSPVGTEPMIQALSALIDIYSDEATPYDVNFRQGDFLQRLVSCVDGVKKAVRAIDRRKEGGKELRRRGEEMWENLVAFVQYRKDLGL